MNITVSYMNIQIFTDFCKKYLDFSIILFKFVKINKIWK